MRLVTRMSATLALAGILVFGPYGAWMVWREGTDLQAAAERELVFLGTSLRVGIENALRDRQISDIHEAALRLEGVDTAISVYVFDPRGAPVVAPTGLPDGDLGIRLLELVLRAARTGDTEVVTWPARRPAALILVSPLLSDDGDALGELAVLRPLEDVNDDLLQTTGAIALTMGGFVLLASGVGLAVGQVRLGRPLERLVRGMRAVRQGDLATPLEEVGDDELLSVAYEFNRMLEDLRSARALAAEEAEARRSALRSLQAADRLVTVGQLSASIAHEIGSPLQVLHGRARAMLERPEDLERTRRSAEILVRETERITRIVTQLLSLTRRGPARREPVDLGRGAAAVVALLEVEARRRRVQVTVESATAHRVSADPDQVQQMLLNLLTNALSACSSGGSVRVEVARRGGSVRVEVADDGVGMDEETRSRAFEPLFTTRGPDGGAGLGLSVVRSLVLEHGGQVGFTTSLGNGTTFWVELPA